MKIQLISLRSVVIKIKPLKIRVLSCTCDWSVCLWQGCEQALGISATPASCWEAVCFLIFTGSPARANSHLEVWVSFLSVVPKQARCKTSCHTSVQKLCPAEHQSSKNLVLNHAPDVFFLSVLGALWCSSISNTSSSVLSKHKELDGW